MKEKEYITQITRADMKELAALTNLEAGFCIRIEKSGGKWTVGVDETALALAINGFMRNGGASATAANCTSVSFNPPS